jgi:hypothetical protein
MKESIILSIVILSIAIAAFVGEILCIVKAVKCNWEPIGKAEVIYTVGAFTGFGCVIGYMDIQDK